MNNKIFIFFLCAIGTSFALYPSANYQSVATLNDNPKTFTEIISIPEPEYGAPVFRKTPSLFRQPVQTTNTVLSPAYNAPQTSTPNTEYGVPSVKDTKTFDVSVLSPAYNAPQTSTPDTEYGLPSVPIAQSFSLTNFFTKTALNAEYSVPELPAPSIEYGVPAVPKPIDLPGSNQESYGNLPKPTVPSSEYGVPLGTNSKFSERVEIPSTSYGVPAKRVPVPDRTVKFTSTGYIVPQLTLPLEKPSSEYGVPLVQVPETVYGL